MQKDLNALRIDPEKKPRLRPRKPAWTRWALLVFLLLLAVGGFLAYRAAYYPEEAAGKAAPKAAESEAAVAPSRPRDFLMASGYVVAHHKIHLGTKVIGKVAWIGVEKGDRVRKGQLLVKLDDREFRAQLEQAQAAQRGAEALLAELQAGFRPEEIQRAEAELQRNQAELESARLELSRLEALHERGVAARQQLDNMIARVRIAEASVLSADRTHQLQKLGPRPEQIELARAEVERAKANVQYAMAMLDATDIRAPIDGTVLERLVELGEMVTTSFAGDRGAKSAVVSLADLNDLRVELDISQADFNRISPEHDCVMTPEAYPERKYPCNIAEISPEANRQKGTIQVKVKVLEPDSFLRPELTARVTFSQRDEERAQADAP
jgi:HlyD family secretion protein